MTFSLQIIAFFLALFSLCSGHSWVERLMRVATNGTMIGDPGYIRGDVSRLEPAFSDLQMQYLLPTGASIVSDMLCKETQRVENYTDTRPALLALPGDYIALQYQENGHVTLPQNDPQKTDSGRLYIYGTSNPLQYEAIDTVHQMWDKEGTGGDRRGRLLAESTFDDGRCYQINNEQISLQRQYQYRKTPLDPQGADLWCQSDLRLPTDIEGRYTLYWVWDWPSTPTDQFPNGQAQLYTSCMDIYIAPQVGGEDYSMEGEQAMRYVRGQDLNWAAIEEQMMTQ